MTHSEIGRMLIAGGSQKSEPYQRTLNHPVAKWGQGKRPQKKPMNPETKTDIHMPPTTARIRPACGHALLKSLRGKSYISIDAIPLCL